MAPPLMALPLVIVRWVGRDGHGGSIIVGPWMVGARDGTVTFTVVLIHQRTGPSWVDDDIHTWVKVNADVTSPPPTLRCVTLLLRFR